MWPGHGGYSIPPHSFLGRRDSFQLRKRDEEVVWCFLLSWGFCGSPFLYLLFQYCCCHCWICYHVAVSSILFLSQQMILTSCASSWSRGEWQMLMVLVGELENTIPTSWQREKTQNEWIQLLSLKLWRCNWAQWQEWCSINVLNDAEKNQNTTFEKTKSYISTKCRKNIHLFHPFWSGD